jgi:hypothetical protein
MIYILKKLYSKKIPTTSIFKTHVNFPNSCLHHPNCPLKHMLKVSWRKVLETDQIRATWAPFIVSKRSKTNSVSIARPRALNFEDYTTTQCPDRLQTGSIRRD